ncbi:hypothetical protein [Allofustis seminis]|uniref:hypothetical protein n=1 Tax=Allofustis seminis TaxID=166939 RepID=UPI000361B310|nr:hypothetical protein [Allofustis seminis]
MDKRKYPSFFKKHPEKEPEIFSVSSKRGTQKTHAQEHIVQKQVHSPSFSDNESINGNMNGTVQSLLSHRYRGRSLPAYFKKPKRQFPHEAIQQKRQFYDELVATLHKKAEDYILFESSGAPTRSVEQTTLEDFSDTLKKSGHSKAKSLASRKNLSISLSGIMEEETRSLEHQQKKHSSLFPKD